MLLIQDAVSKVLSGMPFVVPWLRRWAGAEFLCVNYHLVSDRPNPLLGDGFPRLTVKAFERDLDWLLKHYRPLSLRDVIRSIDNTGQLPARGFVVTFDDGHAECHDLAAPVLSRKGVPAAFFLCTATLDNREMIYEHKKNIILAALKDGPDPQAARQALASLPGLGSAAGSVEEAIRAVDYPQRHLLDAAAQRLQVDMAGYLKAQRPYLSEGQVRALMKAGFEIGSHGIDHAWIAVLDPAEQIRHIVDSTRHLRELFELDYGLFAFPFSEEGVPDRIIRAALDSGLVDLVMGTRNGARDEIPRCVQRTGADIKRGATPTRFLKIYHDMILDRRRGRGVVVRA
ncbi:MAG: polysaccharide deacetylase family protein [Verrucomicrobia bacterium]|nr:polysaccharide deacetylase family protein [Verrucomicrobiota bacterium]